jgi:hypothetical protein
MKWSLHQSGKWRTGFSEKGFAKYRHLFPPNADRALCKWNRPTEVSDGVTLALAVSFFTSELPLSPDLRPDSKWKEVTMVEAAGDGLYVLVHVCLCDRPNQDFSRLTGKPVIVLGSFPLPAKGWVYLALTEEEITDEIRLRLANAYTSAVNLNPKMAAKSKRIIVNGMRSDGTATFTELNAIRPTPETLLKF